MTLSRTTRRALVTGIALVAVGTLVGIGTTALAGTSDPSAPSNEPALPKHLTTKPVAAKKKASTPQVVKDSYIVVFKDQKATTTSVHTQSAVLAGKFGWKVGKEFSHGLRGFSATMTAAQAKSVASDSRVAYVQPNHLYKLADTQTNPPNWGLDRIDQTYLPLSNSYSPQQDGTGVHIYILDSGIRATHHEFAGRLATGYNAVDGSTNTDDCFGHGTHVAGIAAGSTYGVAKKATLVPIKVYADCTGESAIPDSAILAGLSWLTANAQKPAVVNMSIAGTPDQQSAAVEQAIRAAITAGITFTVAAGNGDDNGNAVNACGVTPADVGEAITVGATGRDDFAATFSNVGSCVDVLAPGVRVLSAWSTSDTATATVSGTSMAAPHVAGAAALLLSADPTLTPAQVADKIKSSAVKQAIHNAGAGTPNLLLNVNPGTNAASTLGLRSFASLQFVTADPAGKNPLIPNRWVMGGWETFDIVKVDATYVALRAHANGKYVTAESAGTKPLVANRTAVGVWEEFQISQGDDGTFGLIARANGKYVSAPNGGIGALIASGSFKGSSETFIPSGPNAVISLKAEINGKYVTAENAGAKPLIANRTGVGSWEQFDVVDLGEGFVGLRAHANGRYVTAESAGTKPLVANRTGIGAWEAFYGFDNGPILNLIAYINWKVVTAENAGNSPLIANRDSIGSWELFDLQ